MGPRFAAAGVLAIAMALSAPAAFGQGAPLTVFPTKITIGPQAVSSSVQLKNEGAGDTRFQVTVHAWSTSASGEMQLTPTTDLVAFPTVFALKPGETRTIRVGTSRRAGQTELPYRMVIEELGNAADAPGAAGIQMLRRFNVPIFVQPADRQLKAELHDLAVPRAGVAALRVRNLGTTHFVVGEITLKGRAADGGTIVETTREGWYVLPGENLPYEIAFDAAACARLTAIEVSIRIRDVSVDPLVETLALSPGVCTG